MYIIYITIKLMINSIKTIGFFFVFDFKVKHIFENKLREKFNQNLMLCGENFIVQN